MLGAVSPFYFSNHCKVSASCVLLKIYFCDGVRHPLRQLWRDFSLFVVASGCLGELWRTLVLPIVALLGVEHHSLRELLVLPIVAL